MIGKQINHYKILEKLGEGGMGVVYKAEDTKLRRIVALKFLPVKDLEGEEAKARFLREAQAAAALDDPNICTIHKISKRFWLGAALCVLLVSPVRRGRTPLPALAGDPGETTPAEVRLKVPAPG